MNGADGLTIGDLRGPMRSFHPDLANRIDLDLADTYDQFVECVQLAMDSIIIFMEEGAKVRKDDSEDRLTIEIVGNLKQRGFDADHDPDINGHVDIVIRHKKGYKWLGEAKIHTSYDWVLKGFKQLCDRYGKATPSNCSGGLIIYIRGQNTARTMKKWKDEFLADKFYSGVTTTDCPTRKELAFFSQHANTSSGLAYTVRHMGVVLHHDPLD